MSADLFTEVSIEPSFRPISNSHELLVDRLENVATIVLRVDPRVEEFVSRTWYDGEPVKPALIARFDFEHRQASIFPKITYRHKDLYGPKYDKVFEIVFDIPKLERLPDTEAGMQRLIREIMPLGFMKEIEYGLGFVTLMKPMLHSIEKLPEVSRIVISDYVATHLSSGTFYFNAVDYRNIADGMHRITGRYQRESLGDREVFAFNNVLHRVLPETYAKRSRPYRAGTVFELLGSLDGKSKKLDKQDRSSIINMLANNAASLSKSNFTELIQLQKDIEIVSLDVLIKEFHRMLGGKTVEADWQTLLELNPFMLSMLFGQPIVLLQSSASVGGATLAGSGMKIADFVLQNSLTHNAAIVELKRPSTKLTGAEYRQGLFGPSSELMGAVVQVLDQRAKLVTSIPLINHFNGSSGLEAFSIDCVIIAGRTPAAERIASFELMRGQMKDVNIVTFDELLERLNMLRELLAGERYTLPSEDQIPDEQNHSGSEHDWYEEFLGAPSFDKGPDDDTMPI